MDLSSTSPAEKTVWILVGVVITSFAAYVLSSFFGALVVGLFLYYATRPVYRRLADRFDHPDANAALTLAVVGVPILLVLGYAAVVGVRELDQFLRTTNLTQFRSAIRPYLDVASPGGGQGIVGALRNGLSRVTGVTRAVFAWSLRLFVIVTFAFYLLRDDRKLATWYRRTFADYPAAVAFLDDVDGDLTTIFTGNLITIGVTGVIAVAVFFGLDAVAPAGTGVAFPLLLGLVIGVATLVPALGMKLVYVPYTGYLLWQAQTTEATPYWFPVTFFVVTLVAVDSFPDFIIRSYVSKGELNMGLVLLTYVLGAVAFGWYGVFFGPVVLVFFVNFAREIFPELIRSDV